MEGSNLVPSRTRIRLGLTLVFPDGERLDQRYSAHPSWEVSQLKERMGRLLGTLYPIRLFVGPDWEELDHLGLISDRTLPDSQFPDSQFRGPGKPVPCVDRGSALPWPSLADHPHVS
jgi:hypothetical protein